MADDNIKDEKVADSDKIPTQRVEVVKVKSPGENNATASLILGIIGAILGFTGIIPFVLGIIGLVQAQKAKDLGCNSSARIAGFVLSIISVVAGGLVIVFVLLTMCTMGLAAGVSSTMPSTMY